MEKRRFIPDSYEEHFESSEAMQSVLKEICENSIWQGGILANTLKFKVADNVPLLAKELAEKYSCDEEALMDTMAGTQLVVTFDDGFTYYPVRDTAMKSLFDRTGAGSFVSRCGAKEFVLFFNEIGFPTLLKGNVLILLRGGKVSAVLSDENGGYEALSMSGLMSRAEDALGNRFGDKAKFEVGEVSHGFMLAKYTIDDPDLLKEYETLTKDSVYGGGYTPQIAIYSSDVGTCSATVAASLRTARGATIRINGESTVPHKKGASLDDFEQKLYEVFAKYVDFANKLGEMAKIVLDKPCEAFMAACKKAKLPKKFTKKALEDFELYVGDGEASAHDIYLGICEALFYAKCAGQDEKALCRLEDLSASCLAFDWEDWENW